MRFKIVAKICLLTCIFAAVIGCSSGGKSRGNKGGTDSNGQLTLSNSSLTFFAGIRDFSVPPQFLSGTVTGVNKTVHTFIDVTSNGVENALFNFTSDTSGQLEVAVKQPGSLGVGTYNDTITVRVCYDPACTKQVGGSPKIVAVSYTVKDIFQLGSALIMPLASAGPAQTTTSHTVEVYGANANWTVQSNNPWLTTDVTQGTGAGAVIVTADAKNLAPGNYTGSIKFTDSVSQTSPVLNVEFLVSGRSLELSTPNALEFKSNGATANQLFVEANLFVGEGAQIPIHIRGPNWLQPVSVLVSDGPVQVPLTVNTDAIEYGTNYSDTVEFYANMGTYEVTDTRNVTLKVEPQSLNLNDRGVAFTSIGNLQVLSKTIDVIQTDGSPMPWLAEVTYHSSGAPSWLTVSQLPASPGSIELTANASGLSNGQIYEATVNVLATEGNFSDTLRVGFYVDTTVTVNALVTKTLPNIEGRTGLVADPIRPYVYVSSNGANVDAYNIYTGNLAHTFANLGTNLRTLVIRDDGTQLYAVDASALNIARVDLTSRSPLSTLVPADWKDCNYCTNPYGELNIAYAYSHHKPVLITAVAQIYDAETGESLTNAQFNTPENGILAVSGDGRTLFAAPTNSAPYSGRRYAINYDVNSGLFDAVWTHHNSGGDANAHDFSVNYKGSKLYRACYYPTDIEAYDGNDFTYISLVNTGTFGSAQLLGENQLLCTRYYSASDSPDMWRVDLSNKAILGEYNVEGEVGLHSVVVSGDGSRIIARSNDNATLSFIAL